MRARRDRPPRSDGRPGPVARTARTVVALLLGLALVVGRAPVEASTGTIGPGPERRVAVTALQQLLNERGWALGVDGLFGPRTAAAVRQFQQVNGLPITGVLDEATRVALGDPAARGFDAWQALMAAPRAAADPLTRIVTIADRTGFDWRGVGGTYVYGCPPADLSGCTLGAYVPATRTMYVSRGAFRTERLLEYVVLHEQAHLWQFTACPPELRTECLAQFGLSGIAALQAGADCLAIHWGSRFRGYYGCPVDAVAVVGDLYLSTVP
jgi:hypothetical protein